MTKATLTRDVEDDDSIFDVANYHLPVPELDGLKATNLAIRFSGTALDRTSEYDLALLEAARLGNEVLVLVRGEFVGKSFRLNRKANDESELSFSCTVKVLSVEAGESA